jgi:hypothetical protein
MHDNGVKRPAWEQAGDIVIRTASIAGTGAQRGVTPAVKRHVHKRRLDDRGCLWIYGMTMDTLRIVVSGHSIPRFRTLGVSLPHFRYKSVAGDFPVSN